MQKSYKEDRYMILIGTSGYIYQDWRGFFYPDDLPQDRWLEFYTEHFTAVELNVTFYRLPASPTFRYWYKRTPKNFRFVVKGSRFITHQKRLHNCHEPLAVLFERASELGEKFGCVLWQLPAKFSHDVDLLEDFLQESERVQLVYGKVRQAFEFRDLSWFEEPVYAVLSQFNAAIVIADWPFDIRKKDGEPSTNGEIPQTADFLYFRCHGPAAEYASSYTEEEINKLADKLRSYSETDDIYVFFNNDAHGYAIKNAQQLRARLSFLDATM